MSKSFLLFFAVALLAITCLPLQGRGQQQTAPAPAPGTTPAPAPAPALTPPETEPHHLLRPSGIPSSLPPNRRPKPRPCIEWTAPCATETMETARPIWPPAWSLPSMIGPIPKLSPAGKTGNCSTSFASARARCLPSPKAAPPTAEVWNLVIYIRTFSK